MLVADIIPPPVTVTPGRILLVFYRAKALVVMLGRLPPSDLEVLLVSVELEGGLVYDVDDGREHGVPLVTKAL